MLKHLIIILSFLQIITCLSTRSNIWWSRRDGNNQGTPFVGFDEENPSLGKKIQSYCFVKCQQQFAACLLAQLNQVVVGPIDYCENMSKECEKNCVNDKRTSRIAQENWSKVLEILHAFYSASSSNNERDD